MYKDPIIRIESDVMIDKEIGTENYQYTVGIFETYYHARSAKSRLTSTNQYNSISIETYIDGRIVDRNNISSLQSKYPDLINFINYEMSN